MPSCQKARLGAGGGEGQGSSEIRAGGGGGRPVLGLGSQRLEDWMESPCPRGWRQSRGRGQGDGQGGGLGEGHKDRSTSSPQGPSHSKLQSWGPLGWGGPLAGAELKDEKNQRGFSTGMCPEL